MAELSLRSHEQVLDQARRYLQWGCFAGAEALALKAAGTLTGNLRLRARRIAWFAQVNQGTPEALQRAGTGVGELEAWMKTRRGGEGMVERVFVLHHTQTSHCLEQAVDALIQTARRQGGRLILYHPGALLRLASDFLRETSDVETAIRLVNLVLGYRSVFVSLQDVRLLGKLLVRVQAPEAVWMRWAWIFVRHIHLASHRARFFQEEFQDSEASEWAHREDHASLDVLREILGAAPASVRGMFLSAWDLLAEVPDEGRGIRAILDAHNVPAGCGGGTDMAHPLWWGDECLAYRYFWFAGVEPAERNLVQNGEWGLFCGPNADRSMAVGQWWRLVEGILKRTVVGELTKVFARNPAWLEADRQSKRIMDEERVFLQWANPEHASKSTLGQMLVGIEKMLQGPGNAGSQLRKGAAEWCQRTVLSEVLREKWLKPSILTERNIKRFRNASAHDGILNLEEAALGSLGAAELIGQLAFPELGTEWIPEI